MFVRYVFIVILSTLFGIGSASAQEGTIRTTVPIENWNFDNIVPEINTIQSFHFGPSGTGTYAERARARNASVRQLFASASDRYRAALSLHRVEGERTLTVTSRSGYRSASGWLDFGSNYELFEPTFEGNGLKGQLIVQASRVGFSVGGQDVRGTVRAQARYTSAYIEQSLQSELQRVRAILRQQNLPDDTTPDP